MLRVPAFREASSAAHHEESQDGRGAGVALADATSIVLTRRRAHVEFAHLASDGSICRRIQAGHRQGKLRVQTYSRMSSFPTQSTAYLEDGMGLVNSPRMVRQLRVAHRLLQFIPHSACPVVVCPRCSLDEEGRRLPASAPSDWKGCDITTNHAALEQKTTCN